MRPVDHVVHLVPPGSTRIPGQDCAHTAAAFRLLIGTTTRGGIRTLDTTLHSSFQGLVRAALIANSLPEVR